MVIRSFLMTIALTTFFMSSTVTAKARESRCGFGSPGISRWKNEYRNSILKAAGYLSEGQNKNLTWAKTFPMLNGTVVCQFQADLHGNLKHLKVIQSSGDKKTDNKALQYIRDAAPFRVKNPTTELQLANFYVNDLLVEKITEVKH